jgi:hypothetical protein
LPAGRLVLNLASASRATFHCEPRFRYLAILLLYLSLLLRK